jgi:hypothetical protein
MPSTAGSQLWNEGLKLVSFCPVCDTRYNSMEARLLGEQEQTRLLHVQCRKCRHSIIALVLVNQVGASSVGLLTDLSYEDVLVAKSQRAVSVDDVIAVHVLFDRAGWEERLGVARARRLSHARRKRSRVEIQQAAR